MCKRIGKQLFLSTTKILIKKFPQNNIVGPLFLIFFLCIYFFYSSRLIDVNFALIEFSAHELQQSAVLWISCRCKTTLAACTHILVISVETWTDHTELINPLRRPGATLSELKNPNPNLDTEAARLKSFLHFHLCLKIQMNGFIRDNVKLLSLSCRTLNWFK